MFSALASYTEVCNGGRDDARNLLTDIPITHAPVNCVIPTYTATHMSWTKYPTQTPMSDVQQR